MILNQKTKSLLRLADLHNNKNTQVYIYICLALLLIVSILLRISLIKFKNSDYLIFSSWYNFIKVHGISSFKYGSKAGFSNYNPPYSYFLYIASLLPISKAVAIKGILIIFDLLLAFSVYCVVKIFKPTKYTPLVASLATMYLPTVIITGVLWGQFDQLYVAFVFFSLYFGLKDKSKWSWIFFGVAIAIKFQAIFFLPVLIIMSFKRIYWYDSIWAIISFLVLTLPPALAGRPIGSLLNIYPSQATLFHGQLTLNAPNIYQWVPNAAFPYLYHAGIGLTMGAMIFILLISIIYKKFSKKDLLLATTFILYLVPFLLPEMHERYFFPAGVSSMILALVYPEYAWTAVLIQMVTILSYAPFLFGIMPVSMATLAMFGLVIVCSLSYYFIRSSNNNKNTAN